MLLPRLLLCLALFAPYAGLAQGSTEAPAAPSQPETLSPPPLITAPEDPEDEPPEGELFPHEFESTLTAGEPFSVGRGVFEFVGGGVAGAGIGFLGLLLGAAVFAPGCNDDEDCIVPIFLLGTTAAAFGVPLGVYGAAKLWDGQGSYWASFLGTVVGTGLAILVSIAAQDSGATAVSLTTAPILGAMVGYELSHAYVQPSVSPMLGRTLTGGVVAGISARF